MLFVELMLTMEVFQSYDIFYYRRTHGIVHVYGHMRFGFVNYHSILNFQYERSIETEVNIRITIALRATLKAKSDYKEPLKKASKPAGFWN